MIKKIENKTHSVTVRLTPQEGFLLQKEVEESNSNSAEVLRRCFRRHIEFQEINTLIKESEIRILQRLFEMVSAIANLSSNEKMIAKQNIKNQS